MITDHSRSTHKEQSMKTEKLPCELTDEETIQFGKKLLDSLNKQEEIAFQLESYKKANKRAIEAEAFNTSALRTIVSTRTEWRDIEVMERADFKRAVVDIYRGDTGALVRTRPLAESERQSPLFREQNTETVNGETKAEKTVGKRRGKNDEEQPAPG